jgi:hypothetical protein
MGQSVMFDYAEKAFLAQARQKSPDTHRSSGYSNWQPPVSLGLSWGELELKGAKER